MSTFPPRRETQTREPYRRGAFAVVIFVFALGLVVTAMIYLAAGWHEKVNAEPITGGQFTQGIVVSSHRELGVPGTFVGSVRYQVGSRTYHLTTPPAHQRLKAGSALRISYNPLRPWQARDLSQDSGSWKSLVKVGVGALAGALICIAFGVRQLGVDRRDPSQQRATS